MKKIGKILYTGLAVLLILASFGGFSQKQYVAAAIVFLIGAAMLLFSPFRKKKKGRSSASHTAAKRNTRSDVDDDGDYFGSAEDDEEDEFDYVYTDVRLFRPDRGVAPMPPIGASIQFVKEPENKYDSNAVCAVYKGKRVGYLYRGKLQSMVNDWLDRGDYYEATVSKADDTLEVWLGLSRQ